LTFNVSIKLLEIRLEDRGNYLIMGFGPISGFDRKWEPALWKVRFSSTAEYASA